MTNPSQNTWFLTSMRLFQRTGQARKTRLTHITCTICTPTWLCSTISDGEMISFTDVWCCCLVPVSWWACDMQRYVIYAWLVRSVEFCSRQAVAATLVDAVACSCIRLTMSVRSNSSIWYFFVFWFWYTCMKDTLLLQIWYLQSVYLNQKSYMLVPEIQIKWL